MRLKRISELAELLSAIGVIASLIYLAIQVNQSTKVARAEITKDLYLASRTAILDIASDDELGKIWTEIRDFESEDAARKWAFYQSFFRLYELEYNLAKQGLLDESIANSYTLVIKMFGQTNDFDMYWSDAEKTFDKEFVAFVNGLIN